MEFEYSKKTKMYMEQLTDFMNKFVYPNESTFHQQLESSADRWKVPPILEELKAKANERGLWNLFLPESDRGAGLTNLEYAPLCEIMGRSPIAAETFNCSAPDTGNMEVFERYASPELKKQYLEPLLEGKIRSAFAMTEPKVASSDATNIESSHRAGRRFVRHQRPQVVDLRHRRQALQGPHLHGQDGPQEPRPLQAAVDDRRPARDAGHQGHPHADASSATTTPRTATARCSSRTCGCPPATCCSARGAASRSLRAGWVQAASTTACARSAWPSARWSYMCKRSLNRVAFGKRLAENDITTERIAQSRIEIDQARLLVLHAAYMMDTVGNKAAKQAIAEIKVAVPNMTLGVVDRAMQLHGGGGVSQDFPLAFWWAHSRTLRFADGPDEVHRRQIGRLELRKHS